MRVWLTKKSELLVVAIEALSVTQRAFELRANRGDISMKVTCHHSWEPATFMCDSSGRRLFEEVARRCKAIINAEGESPGAVALTLPGSIQGESLLARSSRLGVMEPIDVGQLFKEYGLPRTYLLRDVDCLAIGEKTTQSGDILMQTPFESDFVFVFADEGVGAAIYIDGKSYRGAGHAGPIGRLIVEPDGAYCTPFRSHGPLEVFLGRPFLSEGIVNAYLAEAGKRGREGTRSEEFRLKVSAAALGDHRSLPYSIIKQGLEAHDPIAVDVVDRAARYLGLALNSVITLLNPPTIILGGDVITELKILTDSAINYARRFSWEQAWNTTNIRLGKRGRDHQMIGAAILAHQRLGR